MNIFEQGLLRYLVPEKLQKIQSRHIGLAGAGGLGSNIAMCLVRSGFKKFTIIDKDIIEPSNLNRQYFFIDELGQPKAETIGQRLRQVNPEVTVKTKQVLLTENNILENFAECDIIFEAFDTAACKKMLIETFSNTDKLIISGNGMAGIRNTQLSIKKIHAKLYIVGDQTTQVSPQDPPFAPRVIACAGLMASIALEIVCPK